MYQRGKIIVHPLRGNFKLWNQFARLAVDEQAHVDRFMRRKEDAGAGTRATVENVVRASRPAEAVSASAPERR
jgi:hypothetical protein